MNKVYLLTGGNMGNRMSNLQNAINEIRRHIGNILLTSSVFETAAWGIKEQPAFLNQVLQVETTLHPLDILKTILQIENRLGRIRSVKYGPRIIDIDILLYNDEVIDYPELTIPHPELHNRRFVLVPLAEIAPEYTHPSFQKTITDLLEACKDELQVYKL